MKNKKTKDLSYVLRYSRSCIAENLDKLWETGGYTVGEKEFESYDWVKDSRNALLLLDTQINNLTIDNESKLL